MEIPVHIMDILQLIEYLYVRAFMSIVWVFVSDLKMKDFSDSVLWADLSSKRHFLSGIEGFCSWVMLHDGKEEFLLRVHTWFMFSALQGGDAAVGTAYLSELQKEQTLAFFNHRLLLEFSFHSNFEVYDSWIHKYL